MRRKIQTTHTYVSTSFDNLIERERIRISKLLNFRRNITKPQITEMMVRSGKLKIPKLNVNIFKNVKK